LTKEKFPSFVVIAEGEEFFSCFCALQKFFVGDVAGSFFNAPVTQLIPNNYRAKGTKRTFFLCTQQRQIVEAS